MARLPRLAIAGCAHLVLLRGHNGEAVFRDEFDRREFLSDLQRAFADERVALLAYALPGDRVWLLCTPEEKQSLERFVTEVASQPHRCALENVQEEP